MLIELVLAVAAITVLAFLLVVAVQPLSSREAHSLAVKCRNRKLAEYYAFSTRSAVANPQFKSTMAAHGGFYWVDETLSDFPAIAAVLLKYKKHEWVIFGFERERRIYLLWTNKGTSAASVQAFLSHAQMEVYGRSTVATSVLVFHNHPNPDPSRYVMKDASEVDQLSARILAQRMNPAGINVIEFVCERGVPHEYFRSISSLFYPEWLFSEGISRKNGRSRITNAALRLESLFGGSRVEDNELPDLVCRKCAARNRAPSTRCSRCRSNLSAGVTAGTQS